MTVKGIFFSSSTALLLILPLARGADNPPLRLWFTHPAEQWNNALPIGNGRMGATIFGRVPDERIQFNEDTLWNPSSRNAITTTPF